MEEPNRARMPGPTTATQQVATIPGMARKEETENNGISDQLNVAHDAGCHSLRHRAPKAPDDCRNADGVF